MEDNKFTKGNRNDIVNRINNVHTITIMCPVSDEGIRNFRTFLISTLSGYVSDGDRFEDIPIEDIRNVFGYAMGYCNRNNINSSKLYVAYGCTQSFKNLKYVNIEFTGNNDVLEAYNSFSGRQLSEDEKTKILPNIYKIEMLEINLSEMFYQDVIDIYNKHMMLNGLMSNSYLSREFYIRFDYDGYIAYMEMFLNNNGISLEMMDKNIIDYFRLFPTFITNQKPLIKIVTNYKNL